MTLHVVPCSITKARVEVARLHRHHAAPPSGLFAVAVADETDTIRGVAIVGRPVARMLDDGRTAEVTRVATDGAHNACSMLYGACRRAARSLGWARIITYTLASEPGTSLRAAGWNRVAESAGGGSWHRASRPREDSREPLFGGLAKYPTEPKVRWEVAA